MAAVEPTIRYTMRAGKPVVEVAGTWTVFSLRGIRRTAEKALQAAGAGKAAARIVDHGPDPHLDAGVAARRHHIAYAFEIGRSHREKKPHRVTAQKLEGACLAEFRVRQGLAPNSPTHDAIVGRPRGACM